MTVNTQLNNKINKTLLTHAVLASTIFLSPAVSAAVINVGAGPVTLAADPTPNVYNFDIANAILNVNDAINLTSTPTIFTNGGDFANQTINFKGASQVAGSITKGATNPINIINLNTTNAASKIIEFDGLVISAGTLKFATTAGQGSTLLLNNAAMVLTGNIKATTANIDTLDISKANTLTGNIGSGSVVLAQIKAIALGDTTITGQIFATNTTLSGANVLTLGQGSGLTGKIDSSVAGVGSLQLIGTTVTGNIGSGTAIKELIVGDTLIPAASTSTVTGTITTTSAIILNDQATLITNGAVNAAGNILIGSNSTLQINNTVTGTIDSAVAGNGTLDVHTAGLTISNAVGGGSKLNIVEISHGSGATTFSAPVTANTLKFSNAATDAVVKVGAGLALTANITTLNNNAGNISFAGAGSIVGTIGASGKQLNTITTSNATQALTIDAASVFVKNITIVAAGDSVNFINTASAVTAAIDGGGSGLGILTNTADGSIFNGTIGGINKLATFNIFGNTTLNANATVASTVIANTKTLTINNGFNITSNIRGLAVGQGSLVLLGNTVTGNIGSGTTINALTVGNGTASSSTVTGTITTLGGILVKDNATLIANGAISATGNILIGTSATLQLNNNVTLGTIDGTAAGNGTLNITTAGNTITQVIGGIAKLNIVEISHGTGTTTFTTGLTANTLDFNNVATDAVVNIGAGASITANITTQNNNTGNVVFAGGGPIIGNIGSLGKQLNTITTANAAVIDQINGASVYAKNITITNVGGTLEFVTTANNVNAAIDGPGILKNSVDGTTFNGTIGGTTAIALFAVNGNTTVNANTKTTNIVIANTKTLTIGNGFNITSAIDGAAAMQGNLVLLGSTVTGAIGGIASINTLTVGNGSTTSTSTVTGAITTNGGILIKDKATLIANGAISATGNILIGSTATLQVNDNVTTGTIDGTSAGNGTLNITTAGKTITPIIGSIAKLNTVEISHGTGTTTFTTGLTANTLDFNNVATDAVVNIGAGASITANITTQNNNTGNLVFAGGGPIVGNIGASGKQLNTIKTANAAVIDQINGSSVYAKNITITNVGGTLEFITTANNVNALIDGPGKLKNSADGTVFNNTIGGTTPIALFDVSGNTTLNANATATATTVANTKTLTINSGFDITGPIDGAGAGQGTVTFLGNHTTGGLIGNVNGLLQVNLDQPGTFLMKHDIKALNVIATNNNHLVLDNNRTITGNLNIVNAMLSVSVPRGDTLTVTGTVGLSGLLNYDMAFATPVGVPEAITAGGAVTITPSMEVNVQNVFIGVPGGGTVDIDLLSGSSVSFPPSGITIIENSPFISFVPAVIGNHLHLLGTRIAASTFAPGDNVSGAANAIDDMLVNPVNISGNLLAILNQMSLFTDGNVFRADLETLVPLVDAGIVGTMLDVMDTTNQAIERSIEARKDKYRKRYNTGYAAGDIDDKGRAVWVKFFGQTAHQKTRKDITGYDADTYGLAVGGDAMITDKMMLGLSVSWATTDIDHQLNNAETDADNYRGTLYGSYDFNCPLYVNWLASASYNDFTTQRYIRFGAVSLAPRAHYNAWQYEAKGELGYISGPECFHVIPTVSLDYAHIDFDEYMETGAGTANQRITYDDVDMLKLGVGLKFAYDYKHETTLMQPEVHARAFYDFFGDRVETTSQFTGGGAAFQSIGYKPAQDSYNIGLSFTAFAKNGIVMTASYDYVFKHRYDAHNGLLRLRYEW